MDNRPLKIKAITSAIRDITNAVNPDHANKMYKRWAVFHNEPQFINAVEDKKKKLKNKQKDHHD